MKKLTILLSYLLVGLLVTNTFAQAGWQWQNPYLQGNDLNSVVMNGVQGWAVGDMGTVMRTSNSGLDWEIVDLKTSQNLNCIYLETVLGRGWIVGSNGTIFYTKDYGDSWIKQNSGTSKDLYSVSSIGGDCPWICGHEVVLHSYDHGETWDRINTPVYTWFWEIDQADCDEIWVCGNQGLIMSTFDHGVTWQIRTVPTTFNLMGIDLLHYGDYRACGNQATVISSSDGGETWELENQMPFMDMYAIRTRGIGGPAYAVGTKGNIIESLDGGSTWTLKESGTQYQLNDVCSQALYNGIYAVGFYGQVVRKEEPTDAQFEVLNKKPNHYMMGMDFINADTGWIVGGENMEDSGTNEGIILHTIDGGITWEEQKTKPVFFNSVDFVNENEGWAVGRSSISQTEGVIMHTTNGGYSWSDQSNPIVGSIDQVFFLDENNGWIVSKDWWGQIAHTVNGGNDWILQNNPTQNPIVGVFFINPDKGWAVGMDSTILRTTNGGQTWQRTDLTVSNNWYFKSVFFIDEFHGWVVGSYGVIMLTNDGGVTWQEVVKGFGESLQSVFFIDALNGWAVGESGSVLRSIDGGYTWFNQYSGITRNFLCSVQFTDRNNGWISGEGGTIKHTENGGFWNEPGTFLRNKLKLPINDLAETKDNLVVDVTEMRDSGYQLVELEVMIDSIMHTRASDLDIYLTHNGTTVNLVTQVTDQGSNFLWTKLTEYASKIITDGVAPFSGNHKPNSPLDAFNGMDPNGTWTLSVYDGEEGNEGTLNAWGIKPMFEKLVSVNEPIASERVPKIEFLQTIPNPFSGKSQIKWTCNEGGHASLKIYNINGQEIEQILDKYLPKGDYSIEFNGKFLNPGVYLCRFTFSDYIVVKKIIKL